MIEEIQEIILFKLGLDEGTKITRETRLYEDLGADSLDAVDLIIDLENKYNISISEDVVDNFVNIGSIVDYIEQSQKKN